jgi:hypothetical protein
MYLDVKWSVGVVGMTVRLKPGHYEPPKRGLTIGLKIDPKV